jgi:hypothetical protein
MIILPEPKELDLFQQFEQDIIAVVKNPKYGELSFREIIGSFEYLKSYLIGITKIEKASEL